MDSAYNEIIRTINSWGEGALEMLPNAIAAIVVMLAFWFVARLTEKLGRKGLDRTHVHKSAKQVIGKVLRFAVLVAGFVIALGILNLDKALASILAGAGIAGLALGFAFQDMAANLLSGLGLSFSRPFKVGDIIETNDIFGTVKEIRLRTTEVDTLDGKVVLIPNKKVYQEVMTNHSQSGNRRVEIQCGVSYGDDLSKVRALVTDAVEQLDCRDDDKGTQFFFTEFGGSSINFCARFWVRYDKPIDCLSAQSEAIMKIKDTFDANGIDIPFPIRTLDFGIKGGDHLKAFLPTSWTSSSAPGETVEPRPNGKGNN